MTLEIASTTGQNGFACKQTDFPVAKVNNALLEPTDLILKGIMTN